MSLIKPYINPSNPYSYPHKTPQATNLLPLTSNSKNQFQFKPLMARLAMLAALAIVLMVAAPAAEAALSCGQVTGYIASCIPYAGNKVPAPSRQCCSGVKTLSSITKSTPDRQAACNCLKNAAKTIKGLNAGKVSGIPGKCGVSVPYVIGTTTDCSK